jgi:quercetin dioxygenase-like cupin family protein
MRKALLFDGPGTPDERPGWEGTRAWPLWSTGLGRVGLAELEPATVHALHRHDDEAQWTWVLAGGGRQLEENGAYPLRAGQSAFAQARALHGFESEEETRLLTVFGGAIHVDTVAFDAGDGVGVHRHPHAEEFVLVLDGAGVHTAPGSELPVAAGEAVFVDAGEWHGFRAAGPGVRVVFGFLGAGSPEDAGWEEHA